MATKATATAAAPPPTKPAKPNGKADRDVLELSPELQAFAIVKLGRPASLWRFLNRIVAYANGEISRDEWDLAFETARKHLDGKALHPEDAAKRAEDMINAQLDAGGRVSAAVAKDEISENAILIAFIGRPSHGFYHSRTIKLPAPGVKRG